MKDEPHGNDIEYLRAMTDIVERLRDEGSYQASRLDAWELCHEAANEIERLRTVLRNIADYNIGTRIKAREAVNEAIIRAIRDIAREAI